jgi:hypothetical protein
MFFGLRMAYWHQNIYAQDTAIILSTIYLHNHYTILYFYRTFILVLRCHNTLTMGLSHFYSNKYHPLNISAGTLCQNIDSCNGRLFEYNIKCYKWVMEIIRMKGEFIFLWGLGIYAFYYMIWILWWPARTKLLWVYSWSIDKY